MPIKWRLPCPLQLCSNYLILLLLSFPLLDLLLLPSSHSKEAQYPNSVFGFKMGFQESQDGKGKVVFVMGSTGTGKSRLAVDLALRFGGEIVNSDKMQLYDGLSVVTNKVTDEERRGIPHHLLGGLPPDADFSAAEFRAVATRAVESILRRGRLPIVAGGSNSFIEELVEGAGREFGRRFECCFIWVDVQQPVLHRFVVERVDQMVSRGLVEEVRGLFDADVADYSRGIRRAIGVPEMDRFLRGEASEGGEAAKAALLEAAVDEIKANTCKLTCLQLQKIHRLCSLKGWDVRRVEATEVFRKSRAAADEAWAALVAAPSVGIVAEFLERGEKEEDEGDDERDEKEAEEFGLSKKGPATVVDVMMKIGPATVPLVGATV